MATKKISYVVALNTVITGGEITDEIRERLEALKASLEKRNTRKAGPTKAQKANAELAEKIFDAMEPDVVYATADIGKLVPELDGASSQKISALMKKLVLAERVKTEKVKNTSHLALALNGDGDSYSAENKMDNDQFISVRCVKK